MNRRKYLLLCIIVVATIAISLYHGNPQGSLKDSSATPSLDTLERGTTGGEIQSDLRSKVVRLGRRRLSHPGTVASKLAIRDGEIGVVRLSASTMEHLLSQLPSSSDATSLPPEFPGIIGIFSVNSLVEMLDKQEVGGASVSASPSTSFGRSGALARVEITDSDDSCVTLGIEIDSKPGSKLRASMTMPRGYAMVCSSGGTEQGGFIFMTGDTMQDHTAEQDAALKDQR